MSTLQELWGKIKAAFEPELARETAGQEADAEALPVAEEGAEPVEERAVSVPDMYSQVSSAMYALEADTFLVDLYADDGQLVALANQGGKLLRAAVSVAGGVVALGTLEPVELNFVPTMRTRFTVTRQANGRARWFAIAGTNVLNRSGEIDTAALFADFVQRFRADPVGAPVLLDFYHQRDLIMGEADWLDADGHLLLASGVLADNDLARAFLDAADAGRGQWGCSTSFMPVAEPQQVEIVAGVTIPAYNAGVLRRIAILPEARAASWFTTVGVEVKREMQDNVKTALLELFGEAERAKAEALIAAYDETNRAIDEQGLVTRETPLDEAAVQRIAEAAVAKVPAPDLTPLTEAVAAMGATVTALTERLAAVEQAEKQRQGDMPARTQTSETFRPSEQRQGRPTMAQLAEASLNAMRPDPGQGAK